MYQVIDGKTQKVVSGPYISRVRASRRANKLDLEYGAIRYHVRQLPEPNAHIHPVMRDALAPFMPRA